MSKKTSNCHHEGWHSNTAICCDLKMLLRSDYAMRSGREYQGILRRDEVCEEFRYDEHYTFIETLAPAFCKRNPRLFSGKFISVTRRDDGSLRPNFRPIPRGEGFSLERYALGVYNEICMALGGLVEEE